MQMIQKYTVHSRSLATGQTAVAAVQRLKSEIFYSKQVPLKRAGRPEQLQRQTNNVQNLSLAALSSFFLNVVTLSLSRRKFVANQQCAIPYECRVESANIAVPHLADKDVDVDCGVHIHMEIRSWRAARDNFSQTGRGQKLKLGLESGKCDVKSGSGERNGGLGSREWRTASREW